MTPALITIDPKWFKARGGKSPWNVSVTATARVPPDQRLPPPEVCPYCGAGCRVKHHEEVYGIPYGDWPWMYGCTACDARVGMHPSLASHWARWPTLNCAAGASSPRSVGSIARNIATGAVPATAPTPGLPTS